LIKTRETTPQVELVTEARKENIKGVFLARNKDLIINKKILLVDDIYTTGSTLEEAAKVLKEVGIKEIIGIVVARQAPEDNRFQNA
jgi:competence protein ComFC